jgi:hypothetical protein
LPGAKLLSPGRLVVARVFVVAIPALLGLTIGSPLIVSGQMFLIVLDQRGLAARQLRVSKRIQRGLPPRTPDDARLPRRVI